MLHLSLNFAVVVVVVVVAVVVDDMLNKLKGYTDCVGSLGKAISSR